MTTEPELPFLQSPLRSEQKVRQLTAADLDIEVASTLPDEVVEQTDLPDGIYDEATSSLVSEIPDDDEVLQAVESLLQDGFAGVILSGPPGTSKSYYAAQIAAKLAEGDPQRVRFVQFHPSYQYEDFVEGYVPTENGFELKDKHFLLSCKVAEEYRGQRCIFVIDELSRSDPGRVFGEALTYIEMSKRRKPFYLASGREVSIPDNLFFIATMNPFDRGVDEVDMAFERRFARIELEPNVAILRQILSRNGITEDLRERVAAFFIQLQRQPSPYCKVGHAYFINVMDEAGLRRLWNNQLRFRIKKAFPLDETEFRRLESDWNNRVLAPQQ
jgi:5-methylcytosine-specific restriction enzyme B